MNCKLKLHSKGFYYKILGAVTLLKFLQTLALDFPYICLQFFVGKFYRQMYRKFYKGQVALEGNFRFVLDKFDLKSASDKTFVRKATVALKNKICAQNTTPCFSALSSVN